MLHLQILQFQENAHFSISEALIAAIEQMKWNQVIRPHLGSGADPEDPIEGDSDEEIQELKQRIRIRRRERLKEVSREGGDGVREISRTCQTRPSNFQSSGEHLLLNSIKCPAKLHMSGEAQKVFAYTDGGRCLFDHQSGAMITSCTGMSKRGGGGIIARVTRGL